MPIDPSIIAEGQAATIASGGRAATDAIPQTQKMLSAISGKTAPVDFTGAAPQAAAPKKFLELLRSGKSGSIKAALKTPTGIAAVTTLLPLLIHMVTKKGLNIKQEFNELESQGKMLDIQSQVSGEDLYYQSQLPELQAEKQQAQQALLQTIMGGRGQQVPVPGERLIGG